MPYKQRMLLCREPSMKDTKKYCAWLDEELRHIEPKELDNVKKFINQCDKLIDTKKSKKKQKKIIRQKCEAVYYLAILETRKKRNDKIACILEQFCN